MTQELPYQGLALLTDLDGTLLTPEKTLFPADAAAIAEFRAKGGLFSVATGRGLQATSAFLDMFQPDFPAVMYNGALLYDTKGRCAASKSTLPAGIRPLLEELMREFPMIGAEILREDGVYVIQDSEIERRHLEITHVPFVMKTMDEINPESCMKALFAGEEQEVARLQEYVKQPRFSVVNFTRSHRWFLEILPCNTNKGTALQRIRTMLPPGTVVGATGDFDNDTAMLMEADICGCPADAQESVRKAVLSKGGFCSEKTCADGFFADWIGAFVRRSFK